MSFSEIRHYILDNQILSTIAGIIAIIVIGITIMFGLSLHDKILSIFEKIGISNKVTNYFIVILLLGLITYIANNYLEKREIQESIKKSAKEVKKARERWVKDSTNYFNRKKFEKLEKELVEPLVNNLTPIEICIGLDKSILIDKLNKLNAKFLANEKIKLTIKLDSTIVNYYFFESNQNVTIIELENVIANNLKEIDDYLEKIGFIRSLAIGSESHVDSDEDYHEAACEPYYKYSNQDTTVIAKVKVRNQYFSNDDISRLNMIGIEFSKCDKYEFIIE